MTKIKITPKTILNRFKYGVWGTLGNGSSCEVHFLQTILTGDDIDNVKKISEIPESQKWKIKDLFQRNVNNKRVSDEIVPYLSDGKKIKFFNPLTLIVLPHDLKHKIDKEVPFLETEDFLDDIGISFNGLKKDGFYRFGKSSEPFFAKLEWNSNSCHMVAIDGQHRLSALKEIKNDPNNPFEDWKIPAVILIIHKIEKQATPDLLEIVRGLFVDINEKSERLSKSRKIILNDSLPADVLCQEIIEFSHANTGKPETIPLNFFDWRGDSEGSQQPLSKIITVEELNNWIIGFFGFSSEKDKVKNFKLPNWLLTLGLPKGDMDYQNNKKFRNFVSKDFIPAFHNYITSLTFIDNYFKSIENKFKGNELKYFLERERYGNPQKPDFDLEKLYESNFKKEIVSIYQTSIPELLTKDIGLRSIIFCFSQKDLIEKIYNVLYPKNNNNYSWTIHSQFCSKIINLIVKDKWFEEKKLSADKRKVYINLIFSSNTNIINYRTDLIENSIGGLMILLFIKYSNVNKSNQIIEKITENILDVLSDTYKKDIKKQVKADLIASGSPIDNVYIDSETDKLAKQKIRALNQLI